MRKREYNIAFIGAGNVAEALATAFLHQRQKIVSVSSRSGDSAAILARKTGAGVKSDLLFDEGTDIIIIAVSDGAIADVAGRIECAADTIVVHTAGSIPMTTLGRTDRAGVLYPLQTFSKGRSVNMKAVPFFIEASDEQTLEELNHLALLIGSSSHQCVSERRKYLHLAAVFACNFPNFMIEMASEIVRHAEFNPGVLHPLIKETIGKSIALGPESAQTGPARRGDITTLKSHIELLSFNPDYRNLYEQVSNLIMQHFNKTNNDKF